MAATTNHRDLFECEQVLLTCLNVTVESVERNSDRNYDINLVGTMDGSCFMASLTLMAIRYLVDWSSPEVAKMTSYPEMAEGGDWSAVRDSDEAAIWSIFEQFALPAVHEGAFRSRQKRITISNIKKRNG